MIVLINLCQVFLKLLPCCYSHSNLNKFFVCLRILLLDGMSHFVTKDKLSSLLCVQSKIHSSILYPTIWPCSHIKELNLQSHLIAQFLNSLVYMFRHINIQDVLIIHLVVIDKPLSVFIIIYVICLTALSSFNFKRNLIFAKLQAKRILIRCIIRNFNSPTHIL